jgi:hypothetical protein
MRIGHAISDSSPLRSISARTNSIFGKPHSYTDSMSSIIGGTPGVPPMLFRLEPVPFHRGPKPIVTSFKWIEAIAVLPMAIEADGSIRNVFLCRTDAGLERIEERQVWEAMEQGQYREARRMRIANG